MEAGGQTAAPAELRRPGGSQMRGRGAESEAARTCCEAAAAARGCAGPYARAGAPPSPGPTPPGRTP